MGIELVERSPHRVKMKIVTTEQDLRIPSKTITDVDGEGMDITDKLFEVLANEPGIGLSANQIGILKRACVISVPEKDDETGEVTYWARRFINPEIVEKSDPFLFPQEGCLSFPGKQVTTIRFGEVLVKDSLNPDGLRLTGLEAVVAQHEIDHTFGITMLMRRAKDVGVNKPCVCGSEKKFKKCCYGKLKERRLL